ncbi:MAG: molybdopterin-dependent oxidoreductase [bacterium]|nr:molybdopterin-dependent oxidoreductase [bacterium]
MDRGSGVKRRDFLKGSGATVAAIAAGELLSLGVLKPASASTNPLASYPNRDWETLYRDVYSYDDSFVFVCTPNCTHNCYLQAYVKNGVITRCSPTQRYNEATDVYESKASQRWDPRHCNKGVALVRRFSGDRRVKSPKIRRGFMEWVERGFPRNEDGLPPAELFRRGEDTFMTLSWDEAFSIIARVQEHLARYYTGDKGAQRLLDQDYHPEMVKACEGAGTRTLKFRGGMPVLGSIKLFGQYRQANSMALLDAHIRGVGPDEAKGGTGFDNYTWHTDLPPGHPMVCGQQTIDFDLANVEYSKAVVCWGMNWISTKMPDAHFLTEARLKGTKVISVTTEYSSTASKSDEIIVIRPGTDPALALGVAREIIDEGLYDEEFVKGHTDLPLLVRMDTKELLRAADIIPGYENAELKRTKVLKPGEKVLPYATNEGHPAVNEEMREQWGDFVVWDTKTGTPAAVSRDDIGKYFFERGVDPALEGTFKAKVGGTTVELRSVFDLVRQHLRATWSLENTTKVTWAPGSAIKSLARTYAANPEHVLTPVGMGPNQMFNADQKDRAIMLVASLTRNIGFRGGNVGSYAGNYRAAYFNGMPQYMAEDPFDPELDPKKKVRVRSTTRMQSAHFYSHGDTPLDVHGNVYNGKTHMPLPTKHLWFSASNSLLGNAKGHYDVVMNLLRHPEYRAKSQSKRMIDAVIVNEWWWTGSCEYADMVLAVDSWGEYNVHDMTQSCTNPFMQVMPLSKIDRIHNTRSDSETYAGVAAKLAQITGDQRFDDYWHFIKKDKAATYIQRVLDHSNITKGYEFEDLLEKAEKGVPVMMMGRTYPKFIGYEQSVECQPWYNRTGRLEFLRDEPEFRVHGENIPLHREPIDSTFYEPNALVAAPHPLIRPDTPKDMGFSENDRHGETRQVRNVVLTPSELLKTQHPLMAQGFTHQWITPKYRHSVHTLVADLDILAVWWGPYGDMYRHDKRMPWVGEGYVDINPTDAKELGIGDGDYIWVDADPEDRPFHGWQERPDEARVSRAMVRARYYPGTPRGVARTFFHFAGASFGSVKGHESRDDGQAKSPTTGYQAMYRYGSHQSGTRSWLRPTLLTDSLVRKNLMGQMIGTGFCPDVHCANGAPRESFVKFTRAEAGGKDGSSPWEPIALGIRPGQESDDMKKYLLGKFIKVEGS